MAAWDDAAERVEAWRAACADPATDPLAGMAEAGLFEPVPDYATIGRVKALIVERTGLLGVSGIWGGRHLVGRHFLDGFGSPAQCDRYRGKALSVAISEPKVGAHPKLLTTRAEPVDGGFRLSGEKAWVSNGPIADAIIVVAITQQDGDRKRYSAFLVPRLTQGLSMREMPGFHALRPSRHCHMTLDGCVVPADAMLGTAGVAYERMAMPFRDVEDAVGTYSTLGAFRFLLGRLSAGEATEERNLALGALAGLTAVYAAGAAAVVAALDRGDPHTQSAALIGLRVLAGDVMQRLRSPTEGLGTHDAATETMLGDLDATLGIARGPRLARQARLGASVSARQA